MASPSNKITVLPKECTIRLRRRLGGGRCGVVYKVRIDGAEYALKMFREKKGFERELRAYRKIAKSDALRERVPFCKFVVDRVHEAFPRFSSLYKYGLCIDIIHGELLSTVVDALSTERCQEVRDSLRDTLRLLHEAGLCQMDMREANVILVQEQVKLIDFSHAVFQKDMPAKSWAICTADDYEWLDDMFGGVRGRQIAAKGFAMLTPAINDDMTLQSELADLLDSLGYCLPLVEAVQRQIQTPIPILALSIARALRSSGGYGTSTRFVHAYLSREGSKPQHREDRSMLGLRILYARHPNGLSIEGADALYRETIADFKQLVGATDSFTSRLRYDYAMSFHKRRQWASAMGVCLETLEDLSRPLRQTTRDSNADPALVQPTKPTAKVIVEALVELVRELLPHVEDESVRTRAEEVLERMSRSEEAQHEVAVKLNRKRSTPDMDTPEDSTPLKRVKAGDLSVDETNADSDKENNT